MNGSRLLPIAIAFAVLVLFAALTHLVAILILPEVATHDAYSQLIERFDTARTQPGMLPLPPSRPGDTLVPFRDPAAVQGVCFFDLAKAPLRVRTKTEDGRLLTLSFRTADGRIFYAITNRAALREAIDIRLVDAQQLKDVEAGDAEDQVLPSELRLKAPALKGLVVATALVGRPSEAQDARDRIKAITCAPEPLPPPA